MKDTIAKAWYGFDDGHRPGNIQIALERSILASSAIVRI
jgi:hypothetical protein